jgi:hypothetical protein
LLHGWLKGLLAERLGGCWFLATSWLAGWVCLGWFGASINNTMELSII